MPPPISPNFNNDLIDQKIKIGSIISINFDNIDHPKWNIILDITDDMLLVASVFINSEINFNHINTDELKGLQYEINKENFNFLDHDSFVDCSKIFVKSYSEFKNVLINNANKKKGDLQENDIENIIELVKKSKNIERKHKKKFVKLFNI